MAEVVRKKDRTLDNSLQKKTGYNTGSPKVSLPTKKSIPSEEMEDYTWMIYGEPKIGKTSLIQHFGETLYLMFEPGGKSLQIYQTPVIKSWDQFIGYLDLLENEDNDFDNVCIDTGQLCYERCFDFICQRKGILHPGTQKDRGATWKEITQEFTKAHLRIAAMQKTFFVLAHERVSKRETMGGDSYDVIGPAFSPTTEEFYAGVIDNILYYHFERNKRWATIRGDDYVLAGTRCEGHFLTTKGEPIKKIPMGDSSEEAFDNIVTAFNNEQKEPYYNSQVKTKKKSY